MDYKQRILSDNLNIQSSFEHIVIYYILSGEVEINKNQTVKVFREDQFFLVKPFSPPIILNNNGEVLELTINKRSFNRFSLLNSNQAYAKELEVEDIDAAIKQEILNIIRTGNDTAKFATDLHMIRLINFIHLGGYNNNYSNVTNPLIVNVLHYINENYKSQLTVSKIAEHFFVNASYLSRLFSETLNIPLLKYIRKIKMYNVASDIVTLGFDQDIWKDYGFKSYESYLKNFKKTFDMTPSEFLKNHLSTNHKKQ
ncbi:helix-turn-helix transcriptional regulator [Staphylococcus americanisciuri]|uniref:Helix-turn-helix transcriptional regulator n=1 Tax=Staphylococcus americanisciuri TaxID=2973940 RepID=A0ABT2F321_9STAP|nr:helix-turn-helix transcriptional regulator [Staphylococcus americanisciuri]MCS4486863.1 helix-turn-helix transcriptional regulator [Staphylococcus americanisciuri]